MRETQSVATAPREHQEPKRPVELTPFCTSAAEIRAESKLKIKLINVDVAVTAMVMNPVPTCCRNVIFVVVFIGFLRTYRAPPAKGYCTPRLGISYPRLRFAVAGFL